MATMCFGARLLLVRLPYPGFEARIPKAFNLEMQGTPATPPCTDPKTPMLKTSAELLSGFGPAVSSCEKLRFDPAIKFDPHIEIFNTQNKKMNWHAPNTSS